MEQLKQESELVSKPPKSFKSDIKAYWQGHAPLAKAFWGLGIIGEPVFFLFIALFVALFARVHHDDEVQQAEATC